MASRIVFDRKTLGEICRQHHVRTLALFGGRRLDLVTPKFLNARIRDRVMAEAEVEHAAG